MEDLWDRFLNKKKAFEETHHRVKDEQVFMWFRTHGLETIKQYSDRTTQFDYQISETGISVKLTTKELLILPPHDCDLLELLTRATSCKITPSGNKLQIDLWFNGRKWVKNEG